jgi:hypothetical protein
MSWEDVGSAFGTVAKYAPAAIGIAGGAAALMSNNSGTPQVNPGAVASQGLGFKTPLTTPGYDYANGILSASPRGGQYESALGGYLIGGGLDAQRQNLLNTGMAGIGQARAGFGAALTDIQGLRAQVKPGFGALTDARVTAIRDAAAESIGNLRESMARRGVMGSSFADDAETRVRAAYAREEQTARSEAKIAELNATSQLIGQQVGIQAQIMGLSQAETSLYQQDISNAVTQATQIAQELTRQLSEFNVAGNLANGVASAVTQQAYAQAQLQLLSSQAGAGNTAGGIKMITGGLESLNSILNPKS